MFPPHLVLFVAILVLSQAGNLVKLCHGAPLAIAFYRLLFATLLVAPFAARTVIRTAPHVGRGVWLKLVAMGAAFALHFVFWISAVQRTTVANAAICFSLSPLFTALAARFVLRERLRPAIFVTIVLGLVGIALVGWSDLSLRPEQVVGDLYAILGGLVFGVYLLIGGEHRRTLDNLFVMPVVYLSGAMALLPFLLATGVEMVAFDTQTWWALVALAIFPTILGHASMVYLMRAFPVSTLSSATLAEPLLAGVVAWMVFGEGMRPLAFVGYLFVAVGLLFLFWNRAPKGPTASTSQAGVE
jgi:drug/metabolite transporter (DMT)-like permease